MKSPVATTALSLCSLLSAQETAAPAAPAAPTEVVLGEGAHRYRWIPDWGRFQDREIGNTHGAMLVDKKGRIFANTDTEQAVLIFGEDGKLQGSWGKEFHGGLHGMCIREEGGVEYLYLAHTRRHEAVKTTLDGKVQWTIAYPKEAGIYENEGQYAPTSIAVGPDGRVFVADGYGRSWVHLFDKDQKYVKSFGGPGKEPGKMATPHGVLLDPRGKEPLLLVCDRENHRLQWFSMDGEFVRMMDKDLRRPCNACLLPDGGLAVADLVGRVSILGKDDQVVVHLGDNPDPKKRAQNGVPRDQWADGHFLSPHGITVDRSGNLYVLDWNFLGRFTKLEKLPVAAAAPKAGEKSGG
ncbi:MAG: peptidase [Planctomycetes bacterium]|nr:peptidase [Planctomycetota bacterium]